MFVIHMKYKCELGYYQSSCFMGKSVRELVDKLIESTFIFRINGRFGITLTPEFDTDISILIDGYNFNRKSVESALEEIFGSCEDYVVHVKHKCHLGIENSIRCASKSLKGIIEDVCKAIHYVKRSGGIYSYQRKDEYILTPEFNKEISILVRDSPYVNSAFIDIMLTNLFEGRMDKHKEIKQAWANGETVQTLHGDKWFDWGCSDRIDLSLRSVWRVKPKTININGYEVPEPLRCPPKSGEVLYLVGLDWVEAKHPTHVSDIWYEHGLVHSTPEAAETHRKALLSFTNNTY